VIEPSQTRLVLRGALNQLRDKIRNEPPRKHPIAPM